MRSAEAADLQQVRGGRAELPGSRMGAAGSQAGVNLFEGSEESREGIVQARGAAAEMVEIAAAELIRGRDHGRTQGAVLVRALGPGEALLAIDPKGKAHNLKNTVLTG